MKWLKRILIALVLLLIVAAALPFLVPLGSYLPQIEKQATAALGQPVQIKSIRLLALPLPHVTLSGITVGKGADLKLDEVRVTPDLLSLLGPTAIIRNIELDGLTLTRHGLEGIAALAGQNKTTPAQPPAFRIENIRLDNAQIELGKVHFGPLGARVVFDGKGAPERATLSTRDGKLKASIRFGKQYLIDASAKAWTLPFGPPLLLDELVIKGTATSDGADFPKVSAALYGGTVNGKASFDWRKGMHVEGEFDINHLELQQIASMLSPDAGISGKLDAKPVFSASAASASQLVDALKLETQFDVQHGVIHGVDIEKAASSLIKKPAAGGETRFDELTGHLAMANGGYLFTQLQITSGAFAVDGGEVGISPQKKLSGRINAQVKSLHTGIALTVAGTVDAPLLYPSGGTMTGAAIGTMILGPGVGTSVGAKVGGFVEGLFGKKGKKKEEEPKK